MAEKRQQHRKPRGRIKTDSPMPVQKTVYLSQAVDEIQEKLVKHRLAPRKFLWRTILQQIKKKDSFNGAYADTILEVIRAFLHPLDDATIKSLWKETETGMGREDEADRWFTDDLRNDLEMEILSQLMDTAWYEATGKWPKPRRNFDDPEPDWD